MNDLNSDLFLPDLQSVDVDIILNVLKGASETTHLLRQFQKFRLQLKLLDTWMNTALKYIGALEPINPINLVERERGEG